MPPVYWFFCFSSAALQCEQDFVTYELIDYLKDLKAIYVKEGTAVIDGAFLKL